MTIDRILGSFQSPTDSSDKLIKVGVCVKPKLELLERNEYYQCIRVGNQEPAFLLKHKSSGNELDYNFERNTSLKLTKHKNSTYFTVQSGETVLNGEITPTIQRLMKPISMSVSGEIDAIVSFIKK